jgi:hypothetical protein
MSTNCDECNNGKLIFDKKHDEFVCNCCGLIYNTEEFASEAEAEEVPMMIHGIEGNDEHMAAVHANYDFADDNQQGIVELHGIGDGFEGEDSLVQIGSGESVNVHREKDTILQYCQDKGTWAHTLWWINPSNYRDRKWYCVACSKANHPDLYPAKWNQSDLGLIKQLRKANMLYSVGNDPARIDRIVNNYIKNRAIRLREEHPSTSSNFHYQKQDMEHEYRKTAVLTAIAAIENGDGNQIPIQIKQKGGRRPGLGVKSVTRFCDRNFVGKFNVKTMKDMMKEIEIDSRQRCNNFNKYILVERSQLVPGILSGSTIPFFKTIPLR